jgi:hypothetical protein
MSVRSTLQLLAIALALVLLGSAGGDDATTRGTNSSMFASGTGWRCGQNWSYLSKPAAYSAGAVCAGRSSAGL